MAELLEGIGHNIRRLRESKGWNQTELGFHADSSPSIISLIENGKRNPSTATLARIAAALGVEVVDLFPKVTAPAQAPLPLEAGDREITDYLRRHNLQLKRFLDGEDSKLVIAGLAWAFGRYLEDVGFESEDSIEFSALYAKALAEALPEGRYGPLERKRAVAEITKDFEKQAEEQAPR